MKKNRCRITKNSLGHVVLSNVITDHFSIKGLEKWTRIVQELNNNLTRQIQARQKYISKGERLKISKRQKRWKCKNSSIT